MAADTRVLLVFVLVCFSGDGAWGKKEMLATEREGERWTVSLLAGSGEAGVDNGVGSEASFSFASPDADQWLVGASFTPDQRFVLISDQYNQRIRSIELATKEVTTFVETGPALSMTTDPAVALKYKNLQGSAVLGTKLYVTDNWDPSVERASKPSFAAIDIASKSLVERFPGLVRNLTFPDGMAFSPVGITVGGPAKDLIIFSNRYTSIASFDTATFEIEHLAGPLGYSNVGYRDATGTFAEFGFPMGIDASPDGTQVYIADALTCNVRVLTLATKYVTTLVGPKDNDQFDQVQCGWVDGTGTEVRFKKPTAIKALPDGERLVVTDSGNNVLRIIDIANRTVTTLAGDGETGEAGYANGEGKSVRFSFPSGITSDEFGEHLVVTDQQTNRVRLVKKTCTTFFVLKRGRCNPCASNPCALGSYRGVCTETETDGPCAKCPIALPAFGAWRTGTQNCSFDCEDGRFDNGTHCNLPFVEEVIWFTRGVMIGVVLAGCVLFLGCASAALWVLCKPPPPKPAVKQITFQQPEEVVQVDDEFVVYEPKCKSDEPKTKSESVRHALSVARSIKALRAPGKGDNQSSEPGTPSRRSTSGSPDRVKQSGDDEMMSVMEELGFDSASFNRFGAPAPPPVTKGPPPASPPSEIPGDQQLPLPSEEDESPGRVPNGSQARVPNGTQGREERLPPPPPLGAAVGVGGGVVVLDFQDE